MRRQISGISRLPSLWRGADEQAVIYVLTYFKVMLIHINHNYLDMSILFRTFAHIKIHVLPLEVAHDTNLV